MSQKTREPHLEGPGWFESKVSEAEFSNFKKEMAQFQTEMNEFKEFMTESRSEIFEQIRRQALRWLEDRDKFTLLESRVSKIELEIDPPELTGSPYTSGEEDEEEQEEEEGLDSVSSSSSSTSDSGDSESDEQSEDDYTQDSYFRRRYNNSDDEF